MIPRGNYRNAFCIAMSWFGAIQGIWAIHAAAPPSWIDGPGNRHHPLSLPRMGRTGFEQVPANRTGITFTNELSDLGVAQNRLREIGSGVALGDIDGDGWTDVYLCGLEGPNALYRNLGNWRFEDITDKAGAACAGQYSTGAALVDFDGDGDLDLVVNSLGNGTRAFRNDGTGRFEEIMEAGLLRRFGATSMTFADVDGDGDLDLYVTNYRSDTMHDQPAGFRIRQQPQPDGRIVVEPRDRVLGLATRSGGIEVVERGEPDVFYLNRGGGNFTPARWDTGVFLDEAGTPLNGAPADWGLAAMFRDLNGDGHPDLYVCNDFVFWPDRIWINQGGRKFQAAPGPSFRNVSLASMSVDVADINRDGFDDLFVADMLSPGRVARAWQRPDLLRTVEGWPGEGSDVRREVPHNTLQLARGNGTYAEIAQFAGLAATDWTWGSAFLDVDLDGWEDLLVATGANHDVQDLDALARVTRSGGWKTTETRLESLRSLPHRERPSRAYRNRRDLTFEDQSADWGFDQVGVAQGMALGDLDNDGDLDVVINCLNGPARVLRNESTAPRLAVRLHGAGPNTRGIGARITVTGGPVTQSQEMIAGGRYCSSDDPIRAFATGTAARLAIEVRWRNGRVSTVANAEPGQLYEIQEASAQTNSTPTLAPADPWFEDVSRFLPHVHVDAAFDDFTRDPLLPHRLSSLGPGAAWADLDGDGRDELILGGGRDGRASVMRFDRRGRFAESTNYALPRANARDQTGILMAHASDGSARIWIGESNWEEPTGNGTTVQVFDASGARVELPDELRRGAMPSTGPMAAADIDGDGTLEVFIGGRLAAGRFPEPVSSVLLEEKAGKLRVVQRFENLGMVTGAVFTDLDSDGDPDLAVTTEWGPIRLFRNDRGTFHEWIPELARTTQTNTRVPLSDLAGWWNGIAAGDFDGDGRMDFVASNWGRNWRTDQPALTNGPVHLYFGDWAGTGRLQTLVASYEPEAHAVTPWRDFDTLTAVIPALRDRVADYHAYGRASVQTILGESALRARILSASTGDSTLFLNRGSHFESHPLPAEAQFAPAFGIGVADFDGDGLEDAFLAQNFAGVEPDSSRNNAGTGLLLIGDGRGGFRAIRPQDAGFSIPGDQRGCAVGDWDGDGRTDLVVTVNSESTRFLHNRRGQQGVLVYLAGPPGNPTAVGARLRVKYAGKFGSMRELHAGGGYWSQDSMHVPIGCPDIPESIEVHWPGGLRQEWPWPSGVRRVVVSKEAIRPL